MVRLRKHGRRPGKYLSKRLERLAGKPVSELSERDIELLRKFNLLRSRRALTIDFRKEGHVPKHVGPWLRRPGRYDIPGVDTPKVPYAEEVLREAEKRRKKRGESRERVAGRYEAEVKYSGEWGNISVHGVRISATSLRGGFTVRGRDYVDVIKRLAKEAGHDSFMYVGGGDVGFMGLNPDRTVAFDVRLSGVGDGEVWPLPLLEINGFRSAHGYLDVEVKPGKDGKAEVIVKDKHGSLKYEVPRMRGRDVEEVIGTIRKLYELGVSEGYRTKYVMVTIDDKKTLKQLIKRLKEGDYVKIGPEGIVVYDAKKGRRWVFKGLEKGIMVMTREDYSGQLRPVWAKAELLLNALPPYGNAKVDLIYVKLSEGYGPVLVKWGDGLVNASYFITTAKTPVKEEDQTEEKGEEGVLIHLSPDVLHYISQIKPIKKKYGEVKAYLARNAIVLTDDSSTAVLAVELPSNVRINLPKDKVVVVEDIGDLVKMAGSSNSIDLLVGKEGVVKAVSDSGDKATIGHLVNASKEGSLPKVIDVIVKGGVEKLMKDLMSGEWSVLAKDRLLKGVRKKFNRLEVVKRGGKVELILKEDTRLGEDKYVGSLGEVRADVDKGFSIGSRWASIKPWLTNFARLSDDYYIGVAVKPETILMMSGRVFLGMTSSY